MKVVFCSMMSSDIENDIRKSHNPFGISGQKFQENLFQGLRDNGVDIKILNVPRIRWYPNYPKIIIKETNFNFEGKTCGKSIGFINLFIINHITQIRNFYRCLKKEMDTLNGETCFLLMFNTYIPQTLAALRVRKHYKNIILCNVIGDLHGKYGLHYERKNIKGKLVNMIGIWQDHLSKQFDSYALLSKYMADALSIHHKPYVIMEGFGPIIKKTDTVQPITSESNIKLIFYAGAVREDYGIEHLLKAFTLIKQTNYRLVIAGISGTEKTRTLVATYVKRDSRIQYLGIITPNEVAAWQQKATVVISPRLPSYEYVKYSFPGKTMECLASGKPYIAHRLPCEPPEYSRYIQYPNNDSDESLKDKIIEICELSQEERESIGQKAQRFIMDEKNPKAMCQRIVKMWKGMIDEKEIYKTK